MKACLDGAKPVLLTRTQVNTPTIEQMCQLEEMKASRALRDVYLAPCSSDSESIMVDTGASVIPWWEYLN